MSGSSHVVVIGGGITGLVAAHRLTQLEGPSVTLLEADQRLGGKLRTERFAGHPLDTGAEALLSRVPEVLELCRELELDGDLVQPATEQPYIWCEGSLRPLPPRILAGIPGGARTVSSAGILSRRGMARAAVDLVLPSRRPANDVSIGQLVRRRLGDEVLERLIDPLLGGIHAGSCDQLSVHATAPQLAAALGHGRGLIRGLRAGAGAAPQAQAQAQASASASASASARPTFLSLRGGLERLTAALTQRLEHADLRTGTAVTALEPAAGGGLRLQLDRGEPVQADAVVLAVPAFAAAELLRTACAPAARELSAIEYASVATVLLAYPLDAARAPLTGSGFLVPRSAARTVTACTWVSQKWAHLGADALILKASVGRSGDDRALALEDGLLIDRVHAELAEAMDLRRPPLESRVIRFERALPQYQVGHLDRIARIERELCSLPGVHLAGAAYRGVGVGACVRDAQRAASRVAAALAPGRASEPLTA